MDEINDQELFESAVSDAPVEITEAPAEVVQANDGPARDEQGRFAAREPEQQAAPAVPPVAEPVKDEAHVPSWRLREVNEAKEAAERRAQEAADRAAQFERQLAEFQKQQAKPQEPVDPWSDLPGHIQQTLSPYDQRIQQLQSDTMFKMSRLSAMVEHGKEPVLEMEKYIQSKQGDPQLRLLAVQMQNSDDPVGVAMQWYQRDKLLSETGGDLSSYKNKLLEDALKDPAFLAKAVEMVRSQGSQPKTNSIVQLPPSINRATSAASPHEDVGDLSDRSLYAHATR